MEPQNGPSCFNQVYYVESMGKNNVNPIAIRPEMTPSRIQWLDTGRGRVIDFDKILIEDRGAKDGSLIPNVFEVIGKDGVHYKLTKLTLDIYNEKVKNRVMLPPDFDSDDAVQQFYLTEDFENY